MVVVIPEIQVEAETELYSREKAMPECDESVTKALADVQELTAQELVDQLAAGLPRLMQMNQSYQQEYDVEFTEDVDYSDLAPKALAKKLERAVFALGNSLSMNRALTEAALLHGEIIRRLGESMAP